MLAIYENRACYMGEPRHHYLKGLFVHIYVEEKLTYKKASLRWLFTSRYLNDNRLHGRLEDYFRCFLGVRLDLVEVQVTVSVSRSGV